MNIYIFFPRFYQCWEHPLNEMVTMNAFLLTQSYWDFDTMKQGPQNPYSLLNWIPTIRFFKKRNNRTPIASPMNSVYKTFSVMTYIQIMEYRNDVQSYKLSIDRIEYEVTVQIYALQHCEHVRGCVRVCAVEIKPGMLRAVYIDVHVWTRTRLFNMVYRLIVHVVV